MSHTTKRMQLAFGALAVLAACGGTIGSHVAAAQQSQQAQSTAVPAPAATPANHDDMAGMDMSGSHAPADAAKGANDAMSGHDMEMSAHMFMTDLRPANAADQKRAAEILVAVRPAMEKYKDYHVALDEGYHIFFPNIPQPQYHFTSTKNAIAAQFSFDPARPTSLLYKKTADGYTLVGAMYTAPKYMTEAQLNDRVPLSVARWHKHTNFCLPPKGTPISASNMHEFGMLGSISTEDACNAANGRWIPEVFGWMVHVYPYESDPAKIWAH